MNLYQPTITGSLSVSGSINLSGSISIAGGGTISGTASIATTALTASSADNFLVRNTLTAQTLVVQTITSSVDFVTGSTRFGSLLTNTHVFSGSVTMNPGGLFVSSSGLVGIGTTNPANFLHINGLNPNLIIQNTTSSVGSEAVLTFRSTFGDGNIAYLGYIRAIQQSTSANTGDIAIHAYSAGSANEVIRIKGATGNVGIGTTIPNDFIDAGLGLAIISTSGRTGLSIGSTQGTANEVLGRLSFTNTNSTNIGSKRLAYISGIRGTSDNSAYLEFGTADNALGTQRMVITQAGSVGIGTNSPFNFGGGHKTLDVRGDGVGSIGAIFAGNSDRSAVLGFYINPAATGTIGTSSNHALQLVTNDIERMRIDSNGLITAPYMVGKSFAMTSGGGTGTAITDTGIFVGSGDWGGFGRSTMYLVTFSANPNNGGSGEYSAVHVGYITVYTGWSGSNVTTYIAYTQVTQGNNIGALTLFPTFWNGSSESNAVTRGSISGWQIRIKISGYNSSFTGANQALYVQKIITSG